MNRTEPLILGIETSCDETGIGIVRGRTLLSNTIASSMDEHARYGGVVPEVAARAHLEALEPAIRTALAESGVEGSVPVDLSDEAIQTWLETHGGPASYFTENGVGWAALDGGSVPDFEFLMSYNAGSANFANFPEAPQRSGVSIGAVLLQPRSVGTVQAVSGPYLPLGGSPEGITFAYVDAADVATADPTLVARIDVRVRSETRGNIRMAGFQSGKYTDSLTFSIAARN